MTKILQVSGYPPPRGGWTMRVELLKKQLEAEGHQCVVLNVGRNRLIPSPHYETVQNGLDYLRKLWRFSRRGFIAHAHVNGDSPKGFVLNLLAAVLNLVTGKRCFLTFHAGVDQTYFPKSKAPLLSPLFWLLFAIPRRIICNSAAVKAKIVEYGVRPDKIVPIPAFSRQYLQFERVALGPAVEAFYDQFPTVVLAYIRILPGYDLDTLLDAFASIAARDRRAGLLLIGASGEIDQRVSTALDAQLDAGRLRARVCVVGDLDHDEFLTALTRSTVFVRTPTSDGVAACVLEALALGIPVVAAENGTRPEGVIIYEPRNAKELSAKILFAVDHRQALVDQTPRPEIRDTLGEEVRLLTAT